MCHYYFVGWQFACIFMIYFWKTPSWSPCCLPACCTAWPTAKWSLICALDLSSTSIYVICAFLRYRPSRAAVSSIQLNTGWWLKFTKTLQGEPAPGVHEYASQAYCLPYLRVPQAAHVRARTHLFRRHPCVTKKVQRTILAGTALINLTTGVKNSNHRFSILLTQPLPVFLPFRISTRLSSGPDFKILILVLIRI